MLGASGQMKRVLFLLLLVMMAVWIFSARRAEHARRAAFQARQEVRLAMDKARFGLQHGLHSAHREVHQALHQAHQEVREALVEINDAPLPEAPEPPSSLTLPPAADTLPRFPGLVAHPEPPVPPRPPAPVAAPLPGREQTLPTNVENTRTIVGLVSATEERARDEARKKLDEEVATWLELHGLPRSWNPSPRLVDEMIIESSVKPVVKDYGIIYEAQLKVDVSPQRRARFQQSYKQQLVHGRLIVLGAALAFVLTCLGAISGYIRADEATKGYYTNRLRLLAAAGVGAAGMAIYHMIA
jgi:hypothetical protein